MMPIRPRFALCCCALLLTGCAGIGFPDVPSAVSVDSRDAPWQEFLPIDLVLAENPADFDAAISDIRRVQGRVAALKRRAQLLRAPVPDAQDAIRAYWNARKS